MIHWANMPSRDFVYYATLAFDSLNCLGSVQEETSDSLPARIPKMVFASSCKHIRSKLKSGALQRIFEDHTAAQIAQACAEVR
jgi:hypothetical protein